MNRIALVRKGIIIVVGLALTSLAALADEAKEAGLHIAPQPLSTALREFSEQTGLQVGYASELAEGKSTEGVEGIDDPELALDTLLAQTGLTHTFVNEQTVVIQAAEMAASDDAGGDSDSGNRKAAGSTPMVMAQNQTRVQQSQASQASEKESEREKRPIEEIVVTGTNIRGAAPAGSPFFIVDREEIDRAGFATTQEIIQSLPLNFGGGISEDSGLANLSGASSINLRGLGNAGTLTLVNGRRVPAGGINSDFVDVSTIPATAIQRIEVLADGASAVYGADAIAGVVNIILRNDFDGAETRARFGTVTDGELERYQVSQTLGTTWPTGNAIVSYEYYNRGALASGDRRFTASSDLNPFGGDNFNDFNTNPGNILDPVTGSPAFVIPEGQDGTSLTVADLTAIPPGFAREGNQNKGVFVLPDQERHSVFTSMRQEFGEDVEVFAEGIYSQRDFQLARRASVRTLTVPSSNAFFVDPFGSSSSISIDYNFEDDLHPAETNGRVEGYSAVLGISADVFSDWQLEVFGTYANRTRNSSLGGQVNDTTLRAALADPDPDTAFNPFGDGSNTNPGTIDLIKNDSTAHVDSEMFTANLIADGTVFRIPGGNVKAAIGFEYRDETLASSAFSDRFGLFEASNRKDLWAAFGEVNIPLISDLNARPGLRALTASGSVRYEKYGGTLEADTANPKVGLLWSPFSGLNIRGSYGEAFRTPSLTNLDPLSASFSIRMRTDPASPTGFATALVLLGSNRELRNETARTWTAGFDYKPMAKPEITIDLTYFDIEFSNRIQRSPPSTVLLLDEVTFAHLITRNPSQERLTELCADPVFAGDPSNCTAANIDVILDARFNNSSTTELSGLDFTASYGFDSRILGRFDFRLTGNYLLEFEEALTPTSPFVDLVDTVSNPVDLRMRGSARWSNEKGLSAAIFVNYADSYTDNVSSPERKIDSWTTVDVGISYDTEDRFRGIRLDNTTLSVNVQNLFQSDPPFVNNASGIAYDPANAGPLGRFASFYVVKSW